MNCDDLTKLLCSCASCLNSSLDSSNITANHNAYQSGTGLRRT